MKKSSLLISIMVTMLFSMMHIEAFAADITNISQTAKSAYAQYVADNAAEGIIPKLYLYEVDGQFALLNSGTEIGVYAAQEELLQEIFANLKIPAADIETGIYQNGSPDHSGSPLIERASEAMRQVAEDAVFPLYTVDGNIAVIGDSTISGYPKYPALSTYLRVENGYKITDISCPGDTLVGQLQKWEEIPADEKAALDFVFVQIGLNDMDETAETFRTQYKDLIAQIRMDSPDAKLILGTMLPCKKRLEVLYKDDWQINFERWKSANEDIKASYYDCDGIAYLHTDALGLEDGLRSEYDHGDHIHENIDGAKIIVYSWSLAAFGDAFPIGPIITKQPQSVKAAIGDTFAFTVEAEGEGLSYQWYFRNAGENTFAVTSVTENIYRGVMSEEVADGELYCVITDDQGNTVITDTVTLAVLHSHAYVSEITAPTCTEQGYTTYTCQCGDSYVDDYVDRRPLNILMIGNSFTWDAVDCWYGLTESQTYATMKSVLADGYDVHVGVMYKGSATLAYHATSAMNHTGGYAYTEIGPETGYQWDPASGGAEPNYILDHLNERDWDIVVVQSYQHEADGTEPRSTYTGGDARFADPQDSLAYLLDYFAQHEPGAQVYYYMPWSTVKFYGSDGTRAGFEAIAEYTETVIPQITGTESGASLAGIIPVGTAIENARTTYLHDLRYSEVKTGTHLQQDVQIGLLYDSQHLSFGIGRYIAGTVVAETLIPQEMRKDSVEKPNVKDSPAAGKLPREYSVIAQLAAENVVRSPYQVTEISGYETDVVKRIADAIQKADFSADAIADEAALLRHMETVIADCLQEAGDAETQLTIHNFRLEDGRLMDLEATAALRVGYSRAAAQIEMSAESAWEKYDLAAHLQQLPQAFCVGTNLWAMLEPEAVMIDHMGNWVSAGATVYSITIPIQPGDRIYANSFAEKGIQVSFIGTHKIVKTTFSSGTLKEFQNNGGYLIAPEGAIAVNIPVWNVKDEENTIRLLNYDHIYDGDGDAKCNACGEVREVAGATVRGTVKGSRGAKVTLRGEMIYESETAGSYQFTGVAQGVYDLIIEEGGCLMYTVKNIAVETDDILLPDIELVRGDVNGDEMINARDIGVFRRDFGKAVENCSNPYTDINGDGNVNARDINLLRKSFGKSAAKDCTVEYTP